MKDRIKEVLEDHRGWDDLDYLAGLIEYRIRERQREENLGIERIGEQSTAEKISQHKTDGIEYDGFEDESTRLSGIEYSEFAELSFGNDEITHDGDGKPLTKPNHERKVKSYGFFKNEYYDD